MTADIDNELERVKRALREWTLSIVKQVYTNWPDSFDATPCIVILQAGESAADHRDDDEYLTDIEWYVRVFAKKEADQRTICRRVADAMRELGYARTFRWDEGAADIRQTVFRFERTL